jgi:uncharacterized protein YndB with AHSA1/START domain/predicted enzyme related to lactoylglutathione lyase
MTIPSLTMVRKIRNRPDKVFAAWIDPTLIARWMGPQAVAAVEAQTDPRVGGRYQVIMRMPDGEEHCVGGAYREIVPNEKLVFSWAWRSTPERESLVTVQLRPVAEGTELTVTHDQFFDEEAATRHRGGWTSALDRLVAEFDKEKMSMNTTPHGAFHWNELLTRDVKGARDFYAKALGWTFETMAVPGGIGDYTIAKSGDAAVGGIFEMNGPQFENTPPHWMAYISVDDIDARIEGALKIGAKVMMPAMDIEGVGRFAVIQDPTGAYIGWITPTPCAS